MALFGRTAGVRVRLRKFPEANQTFAPRGFSVSIESKRGSRFLVLTRFLNANRVHFAGKRSIRPLPIWRDFAADPRRCPSPRRYDRPTVAPGPRRLSGGTPTPCLAAP